MPDQMVRIITTSYKECCRQLSDHRQPLSSGTDHVEDVSAVEWAIKAPAAYQGWRIPRSRATPYNADKSDKLCQDRSETLQLLAGEGCTGCAEPQLVSQTRGRQPARDGSGEDAPKPKHKAR